MAHRTKIGVVGAGAIGSAVCKTLISAEGIKGFSLQCISDPQVTRNFGVPNLDVDALIAQCDLIVECLPAKIVPRLARKVFDSGKDMIVISAASLLVYPEILEWQKNSASRIFVPSGALCGIDGVKAMKELGIKSSKIATTKPPKGFAGAPYVEENQIDLEGITEKTCIFSGNALAAAKGFPANINVAATLSLAGIGPDNTQVEIWADPAAKGNAHEVTVQSAYSTLNARIENMPDPANPKSSILAAQSIVATLRDRTNAIAVS
ncbi:MAG: DUF108 domain-containing protein [Alphaproteobacteria bacterium]|nr:DUF108 domain-containing protein [Alphaproteobacteria bacterium]